jgi:hypothetical protein
MTKSTGKYLPKTRWTPADDNLLRTLYPDNTTAVLARLMNVGTRQIYTRATTLGLRKSPEYLASEKSGRILRGKRDPRMMATQFAPGQTPWNKGTHFVAGGRSAETRFKKGMAPQEHANYLPIGSLRLSKDNYLERKMTDDPRIVPARRWVPVHRLVWEAAHGPIPKGQVVVYKPGRKTTELEQITPDALECITRAELAHRNGKKLHDPALGGLYQLKGAINRQVNRLKQEQNHVK